MSKPKHPPKNSPSITSLFSKFEGVDEVELEEAEIDEDDQSVIPAAISVGLSPDATGFHMLEFIAWAVSDMEGAGASVHLHVEAPPPWLNEPGKCLVVSIYVNPRSDDCSAEQALQEITEEIADMANFFQEMYEDHWPACRPKSAPLH